MTKQKITVRTDVIFRHSRFQNSVRPKFKNFERLMEVILPYIIYTKGFPGSRNFLGPGGSKTFLTKQGAVGFSETQNHSINYDVVLYISRSRVEL